MISGTIGSEIIPDGIGYNTTYMSKFLEWRKSGSCLTDKLKDTIKINIHNHVPWMSHNIMGEKLSEEEKTKHYRDHNVSDDDITKLDYAVMKTSGNIIYSSTHPDLTLNTFTEWNKPQRKQQFYENERLYIKHIQADPTPMLFWNDLCHWHEAVYYPRGHDNDPLLLTSKDDALNDSVLWLKNWDFNEPNSIFFIYADHSHRVASHLDPAAYWTWVYFKDTREILTLDKMIQSSDFYHLAHKVFDLDLVDRSKWSKDPTVCEEKRIFACEDARASEPNKTIATTFLRAVAFNSYWISVVKKIPNDLYLIITTFVNKYTYTLYQFTDENFDTVIDSYSIKCDGPLDSQLKVKPIVDLTTEILNEAKCLYNNFI
jgi:hypothetical protein